MLINRTELNYDLFFLASIKLLINKTIDKAEVTTIDKTLSKPVPPDSIFLGSVIPQSATNIKRVNSTAMWATTLFSFLTPFWHANKTTPKPTGINAVGADSSKYPQRPIPIKQIEFKRLALLAFIVYLFSLFVSFKLFPTNVPEIICS